MNLFSFLRILFISMLMLSSIHTLYAQTKVVYGQVLDELLDEPLIGVVVSLTNHYREGTYVTTDYDGCFSITVPEDTQTLYFSYIGYQSQTVQITVAPLRVVLKEDTYDFNDIPIPSFFPIRRDGLSRKHTEGVTSAPVSFPVPSFRMAADPVQMLEGTSPGLRTLPLVNGAPQAFQAFIRGVHSFSSASPLYVIDGVPMPEDPSGLLLSHLNTADISALYVLRNPDETAFYGAQGANGVILIYTQNADRYRGKAKFRLSARGGYTRKPDTEVKETVHNVFSQQYTASFTTGSDSRKNKWTPYAHVSLDYLNAPSVVKGNDMERYSILANIDQQPGSRVEYGVGLHASRLKIDRREASRAFVSPYLRWRINDYFSFTSRESMDKTRSIAEYLPSYYPAERTQWTASNLVTYKNDPVYYYSYDFMALVTAGHEMKRVYGTTLHSFPLHIDLTHSSVGKLSANYRLEGHHALGQTRWGSFGSLGYRLNVHNWIYPDNDNYRLFLRSSYASVGNISPLLSDSWERTGTWDVGLDFYREFRRLFLRAVSFSADYYRHTTRDLLLPGRELWDDTLFGYRKTDADIRNQGMEFALSMLFSSWRNSWHVDLTASRNTRQLKRFDATQAAGLLLIDPCVGYYYDPDWFGSVIQNFKMHGKIPLDIRLQCNYSLGDGKPLVMQQASSATPWMGERGNYFSVYSLNFTYHLKPMRWLDSNSPASVFIEGNNLHTFGKKQVGYPDYLTAGKNIVAGFSFQL